MLGAVQALVAAVALATALQTGRAVSTTHAATVMQHGEQEAVLARPEEIDAELCKTGREFSNSFLIAGLEDQPDGIVADLVVHLNASGGPLIGKFENLHIKQGTCGPLPVPNAPPTSTLDFNFVLGESKGWLIAGAHPAIGAIADPVLIFDPAEGKVTTWILPYAKDPYTKQFVTLKIRSNRPSAGPTAALTPTPMPVRTGLLNGAGQTGSPTRAPSNGCGAGPLASAWAIAAAAVFALNVIIA